MCRAQGGEHPSSLPPPPLRCPLCPRLQVSKHPNADALYVEQIDLGEEGGPRQVRQHPTCACASGPHHATPSRWLRMLRMLCAC